MAEARSTIGVQLHWGVEDTVTSDIEIRDFPDLGGAPEKVDITTLSDAKQVGLKGIEAIGALTFTANYTKDEYDRVKTDAGKTLFYSLRFSATEGFNWKGSHTVYVTGAGVNDPVQMKIVIAPTTRPKNMAEAEEEEED